MSSARTLGLADGTSFPAGYFAEEALTPYERFTAADLDVVVATPDGEAPCPEPYSLEPMFHYPGEDGDFLASVIRSFAPAAEDIRVTLHQLTRLDLIAARRLFEALEATGTGDETARHRIEVAARRAWRQCRDFVDALSEDGEVTGRLPAGELRRLATQVQDDSATEAAAVAERLASIPCFQKPVALSELSDEEIPAFDGVFIPGGYGPLVDMAANADVGRVLRRLHHDERLIAAIGHGPAALL
ncbi:MAG: DJ-1/PfpI family protein, partial [Acidimicrobiia bacterium]